MKTRLNRVLILGLALAVLCGCAPGPTASQAGRTPETPVSAAPVSAAPGGTHSPLSPSPIPEVSPGAEDPVAAGEDEAEPQDFADAVEEQAFAAVMAAWLGGPDALSDPDRTLLLWDMAGWYAAREYRVNGYDLIETAEVRDFLRSVGCDDLAPPEEWLASGTAGMYTAPNGEEYFAFPQHCRRIDDMLGVDTEVTVTQLSDLTAAGTVTLHYENGLSESHTYTVGFEPNPDTESIFAFRLTGITPPSGPNLTGALTFTWEELVEANRLENLLSVYPSLRCVNREYSPENVTWIWPRGEELVILTESDGFASGYCSGAYFTWQEREDGRFLASIEEFDPKFTDPEAQDGAMMTFLDGIAEMRFEKTEDGLIWTDCTASGGIRMRVAADLGTLALREVQVFYSDSQPPSVTCFLYDAAPPAPEYLDSWDGPLRRVTVHWEEFPDGKRVTRTETVSIPADWEYLPWQGRWGGYAVWMDKGYTRPYSYPGDGAGYTLYLSTAKG